ncbi:uncharacterized protein LOC111622134 [Centruroides sculpturatus]|uniref:uncharacterized protein LOC111622134 n=1 Tax=Centruroides sculpturatus TaxID=218467 RepID=UPI000C6DDD51|nr:uncharacterized protein LOC111622134 [Centruroides sculpturatus]
MSSSIREEGECCGWNLFAERGRRRSSPAGVAGFGPLTTYFPLLWNSTGSCYLCRASCTYVLGIYICAECRERFRKIVVDGEGLVCNRPHGPTECEFCLAEEVYKYASANFVVPDFCRINFDSTFLPTPGPEGRMSVVERTGRGDQQFVEIFQRSVRDVLTWISEQRDVFLFPASDRTTLLSVNGLPAALIWMAALNVNVHNVVRGEEQYIQPSTCTSEPVRVILSNMFNVGATFENIRLNPRHLYFVKLMAALHTGADQLKPTEEEDWTMTYSSEFVLRRLAAKEVGRFLVRSYWSCLSDADLSAADLKTVVDSLKWARGQAEWMRVIRRNGALAYLEDFETGMNEWLSTRPDFLDDHPRLGPGSDVALTETVWEFCRTANRETLKNFRMAEEILVDRFTKFDSSLILSANFVQFNLARLVFPSFWESVDHSDYPPLMSLRKRALSVGRRLKELDLGGDCPNTFLECFLLLDPCAQLAANLRDCSFDKLRDLFTWNVSIFLNIPVQKVVAKLKPEDSLENLAGGILRKIKYTSRRRALKDFYELLDYFRTEIRLHFPLLLNLHFWTQTK